MEVLAFVRYVSITSLQLFADVYGECFVWVLEDAIVYNLFGDIMQIVSCHYQSVSHTLLLAPEIYKQVRKKLSTVLQSLCNFVVIGFLLYRNAEEINIEI